LPNDLQATNVLATRDSDKTATEQCVFERLFHAPAVAAGVAVNVHSSGLALQRLMCRWRHHGHVTDMSHVAFGLENIQEKSYHNAAKPSLLQIDFLINGNKWRSDRRGV